MNAEPRFPLIALRPVYNTAGAWAALLLETDCTLDSPLLERVLFDAGLAGLLAETPCVVTAVSLRIDPVLAADLPRERLILRVVPAPGADVAGRAALLALSEAGFGLTSEGLPPEWRATPTAIPVRGDPTARGLLLKLLSLVTRDAELAEIEALVRRDANLAYQLLKLVNSVAFMPGRHIENFTQALVLLGRRQLQRWLMLLLFARPSGSEAASPLLPQAALRASLLEDIARRKGATRDQGDQAFMTGMFSLLEPLFGMPLAEVIAPLKLADDVTQALLEGHGPFGPLLKAAQANEAGDMATLAAILSGIGLTYADWGVALVAAARWAVMVGKEV